MPGTYRLPQITGDEFENVDVVKEWLKSASFTLRSQVSKNIVSVGISVVFPARQTGGDCDWLPRKRFGSTSWCDHHPRSCDGECPVLIHTTLYWGLIPAVTASGLEARYQVLRSEGEDWRILRQGKAPLRLAPGGEVTLSPEGRTDKSFAQTVQRKPFHTQTLSLILREENIDEARDTAPCSDRYLDLKTGCAFAEVAKFNIGVDVVYFEDGTIWGNYGYGYALPNPDGIFTRVDARHFPGFANPTSAPN
ncbi:MAG TPA: hypothetical protein VG204_22800 [Terriglobia bacterium]|nr:hypothetical protein [Terriglobia bacterium]